MRRLLSLVFLLLLTLGLAAAMRAQSAPAPLTPFAQDDFTAALTRELATHFNLEGDLQLELLRPWSPP